MESPSDITLERDSFYYSSVTYSMASSYTSFVLPNSDPSDSQKLGSSSILICAPSFLLILTNSLLYKNRNLSLVRLSFLMEALRLILSSSFSISSLSILDFSNSIIFLNCSLMTFSISARQYLDSRSPTHANDTVPCPCFSTKIRSGAAAPIIARSISSPSSGATPSAFADQHARNGCPSITAPSSASIPIPAPYTPPDPSLDCLSPTAAYLFLPRPSLFLQSEKTCSIQFDPSPSTPPCSRSCSLCCRQTPADQLTVQSVSPPYYSLLPPSNSQPHHCSHYPRKARGTSLESSTLPFQFQSHCGCTNSNGGSLCYGWVDEPTADNADWATATLTNDNAPSAARI